MHILFITPAWPPFPGGGERYAGTLARQLAAAGHQITAVTSNATRESDLWLGQATSPQPAPFPNINLIHVPLTPFPGGRYGLLAWRKLMVVISMLPGNQSALLSQMARYIPPMDRLVPQLTGLSGFFDLVHAFNISWEYPLLAAHRFARWQGLPFVVTPFMHFGDGHDRVARNSTMDHQRQLLLDADCVLALTDIEQQGLRALGCRAERIAVVGSGLDKPPPVVDTAVPMLPSPYLLFIGRASQEKGAIHAAEAVLQLKQQGFQVALVLIGQTTPEFDRFYRRLPPDQQQQIRPLGILPEAVKHALLQNSEMLLLPSRTDSFGLVLLEAWYHRKPVIGANAGGIPGVIDAEQNGLLVNYGDVPALVVAIERLLTDPAWGRRLGTLGYQKVTEQYTWPRVAKCVVDQYNYLLEANG